ncbi:MAG: hypothetical protein ACFE9D_04945 [Promethearchaeota archaeon]
MHSLGNTLSATILLTRTWRPIRELCAAVRESPTGMRCDPGVSSAAIARRATTGSRRNSLLLHPTLPSRSRNQNPRCPPFSRLQRRSLRNPALVPRATALPLRAGGGPHRPVGVPCYPHRLLRLPVGPRLRTAVL